MLQIGCTSDQGYVETALEFHGSKAGREDWLKESRTFHRPMVEQRAKQATMRCRPGAALSPPGHGEHAQPRRILGVAFSLLPSYVSPRI